MLTRLNSSITTPPHVQFLYILVVIWKAEGGLKFPMALEIKCYNTFKGKMDTYRKLIDFYSVCWVKCLEKKSYEERSNFKNFKLHPSDPARGRPDIPPDHIHPVQSREYQTHSSAWERMCWHQLSVSVWFWQELFSFVTAPTVPPRQKASRTPDSQPCPQSGDLGVIHIVGTSMLFQKNQAALAFTVGLTRSSCRTGSFSSELFARLILFLNPPSGLSCKDEAEGFVHPPNESCHLMDAFAH